MSTEREMRDDARRLRYANALDKAGYIADIGPVLDDITAVADEEHQALKRAHVALAEQAGRDQAENARLRAALAAAEEDTVHLHRNTIPDLRRTVASQEGGKKRWRARAETAEARVAELEADRDAAEQSAAVRSALEAAAEKVLADTAHIRYGSATDYAERHATLVRATTVASPAHGETLPPGCNPADCCDDPSVHDTARKQGAEPGVAVADVAAWLSKKAREYGAKPKSRREDPVDWLDRLASKVERGAIRPTQS